MNNVKNLNLTTFGFPTVPRKVAIANGSQNGFANNTPCQKAFTMDVVGSRSKGVRLFFFMTVIPFETLSTSKVFFTPSYGTTCTVFSGSIILLQPQTKTAGSNTYSSGYDAAPGGTYDTQKKLSDQSQPNTWFGRTFKFVHTKFFSVVERHSFIPTVSALAYT